MNEQPRVLPEPHLPIDGDVVIQGLYPDQIKKGALTFTFNQVLPHIVAGRTAREIQELLPGITRSSVERARRVFRAKFTKAAAYNDMPPIAAMFDENMSYRFSEIARAFTGLSTFAIAENVVTLRDHEVYERAQASGIDLIFTRDLPVNGRDDISWHPDGQMRAALSAFTSRSQEFPHIPLIVQTGADIKTADDFMACLKRDIMELYYLRFGLLAPIVRMNGEGLKYLKTYLDYPLPKAVWPRKAMNEKRHAKAWLRMAYQQAKWQELPPFQRRAIKNFAITLAQTDESQWRQPLSAAQRAQLAMTG